MSLTRVRVPLARPYEVVIGPGALELLGEFTAGRARCGLLADARALALHGARLPAREGWPEFALEPGEEHKSLRTLERVLEHFAAAGLDRASTLVTFGGGVVCDLGGLAASLLARGIDVLHGPTTLLAQVDAAIGGKTAVNLAAGKNLAGTIHQPRAVFADTDVLATLPPAEFASGLGEVLKCALLTPALLDLVESSSADIRRRDASVLAALVEGCARHKAGAVAADERDVGARRALNLGHTFAHAIEHVAGRGRVPHGVAVAVGLSLALEAARTLGLLQDPELPARCARSARALGLPADLDELRRAQGLALDGEQLLGAMRVDKKRSQGQISLVLPRAVGSIDLDVRPGEGFLRDLLARRVP